MDIHPFQDPIDSDIEIVERLWKKTGCIMYRRLSLFLSGMIFRGEKSRGFGEGGGTGGNGARGAISRRVLSRVVKRREHRHYRQPRRIGGER